MWLLQRFTESCYFGFFVAVLAAEVCDFLLELTVEALSFFKLLGLLGEGSLGVMTFRGLNVTTFLRFFVGLLQASKLAAGLGELGFEV